MSRIDPNPQLQCTRCHTPYKVRPEGFLDYEFIGHHSVCSDCHEAFMEWMFNYVETIEDRLEDARWLAVERREDDEY